MWVLPPSTRPPPPPLDPGWTAHWHIGAGRYYYYDAATEASVWVIPNAAILLNAPPAPPPPPPPLTWTQNVREVERTIASDGACTEKVRETVTIATDVNNMPFVPFSGRPSSIGEQQDRLFPPDGTEQLEDPKKMKMDERVEANQESPQPASPQPSALPQRLAPPPSPPPIMPPRGRTASTGVYGLRWSARSVATWRTRSEASPEGPVVAWNRRPGCCPEKGPAVA